MIALHPRVALGVAALGAVLALAVALSLRGAGSPSGPGGPRLLMPLYAFQVLGAEPVPAPPNTAPPPPVTPRLPDRGVLCFIATERCSGAACIQFVRSGPPPGQVVEPCDPFPRARPHFHRVFVASP